MPSPAIPIDFYVMPSVAFEGPDAFAGDSDRLARFTREAQTLASLNHPELCLDFQRGNESTPDATTEQGQAAAGRFDRYS